MGLESQISSIQQQLSSVYSPGPRQVIEDRRIKPIDNPVNQQQAIRRLVSPPPVAGFTDVPIWTSATSFDVPYIIHNGFICFTVVTDTNAPADLAVTFAAVLEGASGSVFVELDRRNLPSGYRGPGDYRIPLLRNEAAMARMLRVRLYMTSTNARTITFRVAGELVSGPSI